MSGRVSRFHALVRWLQSDAAERRLKAVCAPDLHGHPDATRRAEILVTSSDVSAFSDVEDAALCRAMPLSAASRA